MVNELVFWKSLDKSKLVRKPVTVRVGGKTHQATRWVNPVKSTDNSTATNPQKKEPKETVYFDALGNPSSNAIISVIGASYGKPGTGGWLHLRGVSDIPEKKWPYESKNVDAIVDEMNRDGWDCEIGQDGYGAPSIKCEHRATRDREQYLQSKHDEKWKNAKDVYVRFGDIPKSGFSTDWSSGRKEKGVSVFKGKILPDGSILPMPGTNQELGSLLTMNDRPLYVVEGEEVGSGADGEPVLENAKQFKPKEYAKKLYVETVKKSLTFSGWPLQGRMKVHGMDISIENRKGSVRRGVDKDGHKWKRKMHAHYGYVRGSVGVDKDHVDCYIGPNHKSTHVFIINQNDPTTGRFDEQKVMIGFDSPEEAKALYMKQYDRPGFFGSMEETDIDTFKEKALEKKNHGKKLVVKKSIASAFGVDPELVVGIQVEKEHTDDPEEARKIAMDHLKEDPHYYRKLIAAGLVDEPVALNVANRLGLTKALDRYKLVKKPVRAYLNGKPYITHRWMRPPEAAPQGKPSKLNERQRLQVKSPEFKAWFGPWDTDPASASKVVDENGEPKVLYHGSPNPSFTEFSIEFSEDENLAYGKGIYLSESTVAASGYAKSGSSWGNKKTPGVGGVYPLFVRILKPFDLDQKVPYQEAMRIIGLCDHEVSGPDIDDMKAGAIFDGDYHYGEIEDAENALMEFESNPDEEIDPSDYDDGYDDVDYQEDYQKEVDRLQKKIELKRSKLDDAVREHEELVAAGRRGSILGRDLWKAIWKSSTEYHDWKNERSLIGGISNEMEFKTVANEILNLAGYDGLTHIDHYNPGGGGAHRVVIAFDPASVKSATGNSGGFNPLELDIRKSTRLVIPVKQY